LEHLEIPISHRYQHGGILLESRSGNAAEYVGNREYIPGEPTRRLDFRAWARTGRPVVREYQDEFCSRVALVLDTHLPRSGGLGWKRGGGASEDIEAAVSLTASLADVLGRMGTLIELFAAGPDLFFFETGPEGLTSQEAILEILAAVEPTRHNPFEKLTPVIAESLESTSVVVCLFVDWDEAREELVNRIVQSGCGLRAFLVRTGPPTRPFPDEELYTHLSPADVLTGRIWTL
jgi:uncharacterized protein (DUF58 family)